MSDDGLLSKEALYKITKKKRAKCQWKWFKERYGVDLPMESDRVIISPALHELLQARRAGLLVEAPKAERPRIYALKPA
jgi:hypothetical protein